MNIVLTTYNRYSYLKRSLTSLFKTQFENDTLWAYDDGSREDPRTTELLKNLKDKDNLTIKVKLSPVHLGCDYRVYNSVMNTLEHTDDKFIFLLDSDGIYNPRWLNLVKTELEELNDESVAALSIFNSPSHDTLDEYNKELNAKRSVGGFAVALNREVFEKLNPNLVLPNHSGFSWDWQLIDIANEMNYKLLCTKSSYAQHVGVSGIHSNSTLYDKAEDFVGE